MNILSVGWFKSKSSTSLHRHWALEKSASYIDKIEIQARITSLKYRIAYHLFQRGIPVRLPDETDANKKIISLVTKNSYDVVWIDKGLTINKETLIYIKEKSPKTKIVSYSPDNMALRHNQSFNYLQSLPFYDFVFTNKSYILKDMLQKGAKKIKFIHNMYEDTFHFQRKLSKIEMERLGGEVGFIGTWEKERCDSILFLVKNGINVKVFGDVGWQAYQNIYPNLTICGGLFDEDYPKALQAFKISLCFLRKMNFDQQTTRTMEIPACGGFMMAERTQEHLDLFEEGKEAAFFSTNEELLELCTYYLAHEEERAKIADASLARCKKSGYSNKKTIRKMLSIVLND